MRQPREQARADRPRPLDAGLAVACVVVPACLALAHAPHIADAAHDEAVVRAIGLGWTGAFRALDAPWCALFAWLPFGTQALRASLASAVACGLAGGTLFGIGRGLVARVAGAKWIGVVVAAIASLAATLSPAWQAEGAVPAGSALGGLLTLAPLAIALSGVGDEDGRVVASALAAGMALSYEPLAGLGAIAALAALRIATRAHGVSRGTRGRAVVAFVAGCAPFALAFARRGGELATSAGVFAQAAGERGESLPGMPALVAREDLGVVSSVALVVGAILAVRAVRARGVAFGLVAIVVAGVVGMLAGAPAGPTRYGAPVLAAIGAAYALAAVALHAVVRLVDEARIPFARASAAMILVLEMVLPARAADDASVRADERPRDVARVWDDVAFGALPAGAALLVAAPGVATRLAAARASGDLRADLAVLPLFDLWSRAATRELARDAKLEPLWHDVALLGRPQEESLSTLATSRPLVAPYDPTLDRALARHFVPAGLFARFEPEPRGASERRRALDELAPAQGALARALDADPELRALTASLLRARVVTLAATGERDVLARALDDLRLVSPRDPVAVEIARRLAASRGPLDVHDLQ